MARILLLFTALFVAWYWWAMLKKCPPPQRKRFALKSALWLLLGILVILAATGRMHWITVAIAAAIPVLKGLLGLVLRVLPFLNLKKAPHQNNSSPNGPPPQTANLSEQEAWQILGLEPGASRDEIIKAHKRLIQKLHPDRGGNDYLAARINQAKELLLKKNA